MPVPITRISLCLKLCLILPCFWGCPSQTCKKYQDVARIDLYDVMLIDSSIDSIVMKANNSDSIIGCSSYAYRSIDSDIRVIGSKTHRIKFPINVRLQLFSQGDLWKEFVFEVDKQTVSKISGCSSSKNLHSYLTDDYCLYVEKMGAHDGLICLEYSVDGENPLCEY